MTRSVADSVKQVNAALVGHTYAEAVHVLMSMMAILAEKDPGITKDYVAFVFGQMQDATEETSEGQTIN